MSTALKPFCVVALVLAVPLTCVKWSAATQSKEDSRKTLTPAEFRNHTKQLADAWNSGDARATADLFAEDALYSSPPSAGIHDGRQELFEWFGGAHGRPKPMQMVWHHLVFDEEQQIGAGEYTFTYGMRTHGMVLIRSEAEKSQTGVNTKLIRHWIGRYWWGTISSDFSRRSKCREKIAQTPGKPANV